MNYTQLFEKMRLEALKEGAKGPLKTSSRERLELFKALSSVPEIVVFDYKILQEFSELASELLAVARESSPDGAMVQFLESCVLLSHHAVCAIWYKEESMRIMVEKIISDPMEAHRAMKAIRAGRKP